MLVTMNDILLPAKKGGYGVGFFNAVNVEMARAIIETAEKLHAPVMVGTAEVLLPAMDLVRVAEYLIPMAKQASVPVCVHYDTRILPFLLLFLHHQSDSYILRIFS